MSKIEKCFQCNSYECTCGDVDITPGQGIYSVLKNLDYKPWFALAEFIDNSIQSFYSKKIYSELKKINPNIKCKIFINISRNTITISDNAGGITQKDFPRAFRPASAPADASGLSEFGMGMKNAACCFSPLWEVNTKPLGEEEEKKITFDVEKVRIDNLTSLNIKRNDKKPKEHGTTLTLKKLYKTPKGKTIEKIKNHLSSIYRVLMEKDDLNIYFNEELLKYKQDKVLNCAWYENLENNIESPKIYWKQKINLDLGDSQRVHGWVGLREDGSQIYSGLSLFRRKRLIVGSGDEKYRPYTIFRQPGGTRYLRIFGELHYENFHVTHTKDGFKWDGEEDTINSLIKEELKKPYFKGKYSLLDMADRYQPRKFEKNKKKIREENIKSEEVVPNVLANADKVAATINKYDFKKDNKTPNNSFKVKGKKKTFTAHTSIKGNEWQLDIVLSHDSDISEKWLRVSHIDTTKYKLQCVVNMNHKFTSYFTKDSEELRGIMSLAIWMSLAEGVLKTEGEENPAALRNLLNEILRTNPAPY